MGDGPLQFGDYRAWVVPDAEFRLDGGAMFGVVPRSLWSRVAPPDEENRVLLNMNCLYVEAAGERVLVETGIGDKWTPRQTATYAISREGSLGERLRAVALVRRFGVLILAPRDEVARVRERGNSAPLIVERRVAARVVEVQVRVDDDGQVFGGAARNRPE